MFSRNFLRRWFGSRPATIRQAASQRPSHRGQPRLEELESRLVMTAKVSLTSGVLRAVCDNAATAVTLNQSGTTTILNGFRAASTSISRIEILGGAGNDVIRVLDTPAGKPVVVRSNGGNDNITIGNPAIPASVRGDVTVDAGAGDDVLRVDSASASSRLVLNCGVGEDLTYLHAAASRNVTVNDPITNGEKGWVAIGGSKVNLTGSTSKITGAVHINSAATLYVMDVAEVARTITLDQDSTGRIGRITGLTAVPITYAAGQVNVLGVSQQGHAGNRILINNPAVRKYTSIETGMGDDTVTVQATVTDLYSVNFDGRDTFTLGQAGLAGGSTLANLRGNVMVGDYESGQTDLVVDSSGDSTAHDIVFGDSSAFMAGLGGIASITGLTAGEIAIYGSGASLTVRGGAQDTFTQVGNFDFPIEFEQDALALAAIQKRHAELSGARGILGAAVSGLLATPDGRSLYMDFQKGSIYWTAERGALALHSGNFLKYQQLGRHAGPLGLPINEEATILNGAASIGRYERGAVYWSQGTGMQAVHSGNWVKYQELGAHNSGMGLPISEETSILNGTAVVANYQHGAIYWSQATGLHAVHSGNWVKYKELGAHNSGMGLPISDETSILNGTAVVANYQHGAIYYSQATGMLALHSGNWLKYKEKGAHDGPLGLPLSEHISILGGRAVMVRYQHGAIYWSPETGVQSVWGLIAERYDALGGPNGLLGLPVSDEFTGIDGWRVSRFENGSIVFRNDRGVQLSFDRTEMLRLFARVGQDGKVDQGEMNFLRGILADGNVHMPEYVRNLANKVVNGDRANGTYRGQPLGNLEVGSSGVRLAQLVGKWFRGEGGAGWAGGQYAYATGQLFGHGGPREYDIDQGKTGDCFFMAPLAAVVNRHPQTIRDMFIDNGDGTFTVRFYREGRPEFVTVDRWFPVSANGKFKFANNSLLVTDPNAVLWGALAEKAYVQLNESGWLGLDGTNSYEGIAGGHSWVALNHITGLSTGYAWMEDVLGKYLDDMIDDWRAGYLIVLGSPEDADDIENHVIEPQHDYALLAVSQDNERFLVYNPWGDDTQDASDGYIWLNRHDMLVNFTHWTWGD